MFNKNTLIFLLVVLLKQTKSVPPSASTETVVQDDLNTLKYITKSLAVQLEKWNNLFLTNLEPRMSASSSVLASIDSNVNNLQERAHVWDTFQLHVSAWNAQLSSLDRKVDIISKGQEKIFALEAKINAISNVEYKIENLSKSVEKIQEHILNIKDVKNSEQIHKNHDVLFGEFAARGILSTIKQVEKKLDRLLISQHNAIIKVKSNDERPKLMIKCNVPKTVEEILNDVSSKVDVIFDKISGKEEGEYDLDEYVEDGSGTTDSLIVSKDYDNNVLKKLVKKINKPCKKLNQSIEDLLEITNRLEDASKLIQNKQNINQENLAKIEANFQKQCQEIGHQPDWFDKFNNILESHFSDQRLYFDKILKKHFQSNICIKSTTVSQTVIPKPSIFFDNEKALATEPTNFNPQESVLEEPNTQSCDDLDVDQKSGVYVFANSTDPFNKRLCLIRPDGIWTVIQKRDYFPTPQDFNVSWQHYKTGFGDLNRDFWFGNDYIHKLSFGNNATLRIELEDFDGNFVWAEYVTFSVLSEQDNYKLLVGGYSGNATDSFSSHNGSLFSTFDRKNDQAPDCCPCSDSYGGGWWFNSCFDSNLNGIYYKSPITNTYFKGVIWEHWLGNYSLKKSMMMLKFKPKTVSEHESTTKLQEEETTLWPYYEDP